MRTGTWLFAASLMMACGPLPASTKVGPANKGAEVDPDENVDDVDDGFYREGVFEVGLGRGYAVVDDHKVALTGRGGLADILKQTPYIDWQVSLRSDATGRDLIAALKAAVSADFRNFQLAGIADAPRIFIPYIKPAWRKPEWENIAPALVLNIAKDRVRLTQKGDDVFVIMTEEVHSKFEDAFDKICKKHDKEREDEGPGESKCKAVAVTVDDEATRNPIVDVIAALAPRVAIAVISPMDFANSRVSQPSDVPRPADSPGFLPPAMIQRIIREHYEIVLRDCYEQGLARNPGLEGRVVVKFVIERDGTVQNVETVRRPKRGVSPRPDNLGTTLRNREVIDCVLEGYKTIEFPPPDDGIITVIYPIVFSPG